MIKNQNEDLPTPPSSLIDFYHRDVEKRLTQCESILEIGTGLSPIISDINSFQIREGIDISSVAVNYCKDKYGDEKTFFSVGDYQSFQQDLQYDLIIDGHCFYYLIGEEERLHALENVAKHLKKDGLFMMEMGINHKKFSPTLPYHLGNDILYENDQPVRYCPTSFEIENLLIGTSLKIELFYVYSHHKMIYDDSRKEATPWDLDIVQVICKKNGR
jgi:SAM-dependent methyltransferase